MIEELAAKTPITWCPGCPNGAILVAFRQAISELIEEKRLKKENLVVMAGIGCHGKISDYLNLNSFNSLHGRVITSMTGARMANPKLKVVGFTGDGDSFCEGLDHLLHGAKRNSDITVFLHNNQVFALTTGQSTALTPKGFKSKSTPYGSIEEPYQPLPLLLEAGATFLARSFALEIEKTKNIMKEAILHKGFSFVEILQPCLIFFDTRDYLKERIFYQEKSRSDKRDQAREMLKVEGERIPLGVFYQVSLPTFEDELGQSL